MNKLKLFPLFFLFIGCLNVVRAQDETPNRALTEQAPKRPGLLAQLNLTGEQIRQIRRINQQNRSAMREASQRVREANRSLDAAIYADATDETEIQTRVKDFNAARAELVRLRAAIELAVRKVLTAEQLVKFREIRQQSLAEKTILPRLRNNRRMNDPNRPRQNLRRPNRAIN